MYDNLFTLENMGDMPEGKGFDDYLNLASVVTLEHCKVEPALACATGGERFQFVRTGYFIVDTKYENTFNCIVGLKDSYRPK